MPRLLALLAWPLIEIGLFVLIGGEIGLWATLAWVVGTGIAGVMLLKFEAARGAVMLRSGLAGAARLREGAPVAGLMRALAAVLLILPGFLTDILGLILLLPPVQSLLKAAVLSKLAALAAKNATTARAGSGRASHPRGAQAAQKDDIIEGEWVELPPEAHKNRPSRWTEIE